MCRDLERAIPNSFYLQRGKLSSRSLFEAALVRRAHLLLLVEERDGNPASIRIHALSDSDSESPALSLRIYGVTLARETGQRSVIPGSILSIENDGSSAAQVLSSAISVQLGKRRDDGSVNASRTTAIRLSDAGNGKVKLSFRRVSDCKPFGPRLTIGSVER